MPVIFGPSDQPIPNGHDPLHNVLVQGTLNTGDSITWSLTGSAQSPGAPADGFHFDLWTAGRTLGPIVVLNPGWGRAFTHTFVAASPTTFEVELFLGGASFGVPAAQAFGVTVSTTLNSTVPCIYGTEPQPASDLVVALTPAFLDALLERYGAGFLLRALAQLAYRTIDITGLCGTGPPPLPSIDLGTVEASVQTALQIVQALMWPLYCRCKDGTPPPLPPPLPVVGPDPGFPPELVFPCSNVDPCAALVAIEQQLAALSSTLSSNLELTTLLQRYSLPFAFIPGAVHRGVAQPQSFPISRLAAVKVTVTDAPPDLKTFDGIPTYVTDLGWISLITGEGLIDEVRLTRVEQVWAPRLMPLAVSLGLSLREGVTVDWQELQAEP